jgi:hypothetical protein
VIRVMEDQVRYVFEETGAATILTSEQVGLAQPEQFHHIEPLGPMKMRVDFYNHAPDM